MKIFLTGATGLVGGDALFLIHQKHPEWEFTCLVRSEAKGAKVTRQYPGMRMVIGDCDSLDLIEEESQKCDVVLHTASSDHEDSVHAMARGLAKRTASTPGYLIHTSGTGVILFADTEEDVYGKQRDSIYNDWDGISTVTDSLPDNALHRNVDKIVLAVGKEQANKIRTAIVCPPSIYGDGRGPDNTRSIQIPCLTRDILKQKRGIRVGDGTNVWSEVHIRDLSEVFLLLLEDANAGGKRATWGKEGYYFTENGEYTHGESAEVISQDAYKKGFIPSPVVQSMSPEEAKNTWWAAAGSTTYQMAVLVGTNARCRAIRARRLLGWECKEKRMVETIADVVDQEAELLGLVKK